jgi:hypothetical protein
LGEIDSRLSAAGDLKLLKDVLEVMSDCFVAQIQRGSDFFVGFPISD